MFLVKAPALDFYFVLGLCGNNKHDMDNVGDTFFRSRIAQGRLLLQLVGDGGLRTVLHAGSDQDFGGVRFLFSNHDDSYVLLRFSFPRQ